MAYVVVREQRGGNVEVQDYPERVIGRQAFRAACRERSEGEVIVLITGQGAALWEGDRDRMHALVRHLGREAD